MTKGNDPAFPVLVFHDEWDDDHGRYVPVPHNEGGLTKREYFAAMAMQGLMANNQLARSLGELGKYAGNENKSSAQLVAEQTLCVADALVAELEKAP